MSPTLYDQWQSRYDWLQSQQVESASPSAIALEKVLRYLLTRYHNQPEAAQPALGPTARPLWADQRAIVVHQYLSSGQVSGIKTASDAQSRISGVLERMRGQAQAASVDRPVLPRVTEVAMGIAQLLKSAWSEQPLRESWCKLAETIERAIAAGTDPLEPVELATDHREVLPESACRPLLACAADSECDPEIRLRTWRLSIHIAEVRNRGIPAHLIRDWFQRAAVSGYEEVYSKASVFTFENSWPSIETLRHELKSDIPVVRLRATFLLGQIGSLHDVSLLADLLLLPTAEDEAPGEREALAEAIESLAKIP